MSPTTHMDVNRRLLDIAQRLVAEHDDIAAGSVLRCFARAVRRSVRAGWGTGELPGEAERLTRALLTTRHGQGIVSFPSQRTKPE